MKTSIDKIRTIDSLYSVGSHPFKKEVNQVLKRIRRKGKYRVVRIDYQIMTTVVGGTSRRFIALLSLMIIPPPVLAD